MAADTDRARPNPANFSHLGKPANPAPWPRGRGSGSECPPGMPEHGGLRPGVKRRVGPVQATPVRAPCTDGVSKTETHDEDRRLDEESEHRIRPVVAPRSNIFTAEL